MNVNNISKKHAFFFCFVFPFYKFTLLYFPPLRESIKGCGKPLDRLLIIICKSMKNKNNKKKNS